MKWLVFLLYLLTTNVQAHGSSHYHCEHERVDLNLISHCTSYKKPVPDVIHFNYYSEEQIQQREFEKKFSIWVISIFFFVVLVSFIVLIKSLSSEE